MDHLIPRFLPFPSEILVEVQPIVERTKILRFRPIFRNLFARRVFVVVGRGMNIFLVQSAKEEKYVNGLGRKRKKKNQGSGIRWCIRGHRRGGKEKKKKGFSKMVTHFEMYRNRRSWRSSWTPHRCRNTYFGKVRRSCTRSYPFPSTYFRNSGQNFSSRDTYYRDDFFEIGRKFSIPHINNPYNVTTKYDYIFFSFFSFF